MKKFFLSVGKKQPRSLRSLGLFGGDLRVLVPLHGHCVPRREFHVASYGVDDFMRFNLMPCLLTYSRLIKSYATFTSWSCDLFYVPFNEKIRLKKKIRASRENNLTIDGGKTMGVEPYSTTVITKLINCAPQSRSCRFSDNRALQKLDCPDNFNYLTVSESNCPNRCPNNYNSCTSPELNWSGNFKIIDSL